jgi:hypothetical protein
LDRRTLALGAAFLGSIPVNGLPVVLLLRFLTSLDATAAAGWLFDLGGAGAAFVTAAAIATLGLWCRCGRWPPITSLLEGLRGKGRLTVGLWTTDRREWSCLNNREWKCCGS